MKIDNIYTSVACNRNPACADWGNNNLIIFGASNSVALLDPSYNKGSSKIIKIFAKHKNSVNSVKWIKGKNGIESDFVSGSADGTAIVWKGYEAAEPKTYILEGHKAGVTVVEAIEINGKLTVATTSIDSSVKLWQHNKNSDQFECFQTISLKTGFCFAMRMIKLPENDQILFAFAMDDDKVKLFVECDSEAASTRTFVKVHELIGHEDWVHGLDFVSIENNNILLASCGQDQFIRIWLISPRECNTNKANYDYFNIPTGEIHVEEKLFTAQVDDKNTVCFAVSLESVLQGHDGWVYGVHWNKSENGLQLLSSSIDKTLIIWSLDEQEGVWMEKVRVGGVGGNILGFYGGKFASHGKSIFGHGFQGSLHIWNQSEDDENLWNPAVVVSGHFGAACDLGWEPCGEYLFSVSSDQTTRVHAPWIREDNKEITWHEVARPQVHGYNLQTIAVITRYKFASGAEEKIVRTFQAPGNFIENFRRICKTKPDKEGDLIIESMPRGASVPSLGLSNKGVYENQEPEVKHVKDMYPENYFHEVTLDSAPIEETLMQNTLWPESQKLYGHGFDIYAVCSSPDGKLLASACKATSIENAMIIIWDTSSWKQIQSIKSHKLTVTQMKFSPNNRYLISVSRDRRWFIYENKPSKEEICNFEIAASSDTNNGIHSRIIWSCDWSHDCQYFVTTSRDKKVVAWTNSIDSGKKQVTGSLNGWTSDEVFEFENDSVTAVAFLNKYLNENNKSYLLAFGDEAGSVHLFSFKPFTKLYTLNRNQAHHLVVRKLQFRPNYKNIQLASCAEDSIVRIYEIVL